MSFKKWLEDHQHVLPFMQEDDPPNIAKIKRYKNMDSYIKAMTKGGTKTEIAAEKIIKGTGIASFFGQKFQLEEVVPKAIIIPAHIFPNSQRRPEMYLAIAFFKTKNPLNPDTKEGNRKQFKIVAFYQGSENEPHSFT